MEELKSKEVVLVENVSYISPNIMNFGNCEKCIFKNLFECRKGLCRKNMNNIFNLDCCDGFYIFDFKKKLEICTKDNTKVGDTVRCRIVTDSLYEVKYVLQEVIYLGSFDIRRDFILKGEDKKEFLACFDDFQVKV